MKKLAIYIVMLASMTACCGTRNNGVEIREKNGTFAIYIDGQETYIKGIGGTNRLDMAFNNGANACRTWGGDIAEVHRIVEDAAANNMYVMQGISLPKDPAMYYNEEYKAGVLAFCRDLATEFKDDPNIIIWGIGNEIDLGDQANIGAAWMFVDEIAREMKAIDKRHLMATVIAHNKSALDSIAVYAPNLDIVGINSYGDIYNVKTIVAESLYNGPYLITEWGPTGWWETVNTSWGAPIEQTSEEKRIVYEDRYNKAILGDKNCLGSFVFLWGQKEERTPTWFSMFVEDSVEGLPINGEKTPMVEAMERVWTGEEPAQTAPVIRKATVNNKTPKESPAVKRNVKFNGEVDVYDANEDTLTYVWEILLEATITSYGGGYEPRPDRYGKVKTTSVPSVEYIIPTKGNYRLYCYILDGTGFVSTCNVPFQVN